MSGSQFEVFRYDMSAGGGIALDTDLAVGQLFPTGHDLRVAMQDVSQHAHSRGDAIGWASHLRFSTADTHGDQEASPGAITDGQESSDSLSTDGNEFGDGSEALCSCQAANTKRLRGKEHTLMLTTQLPECTHYVAVSYSWQSMGAASYDGPPYAIRGNRGLLRSTPCPPALLSRVIPFTAHEGLRFFWIDQECILQDDPDDKELGIQAMDLVYENAECCVAILNAHISEQSHIDALDHLFECPPDGIDLEILPLLLEVLEIIIADPWFERAWCLQESTSGGRNMTLLALCDPDLEISPAFGYTIPGNVKIDLMQLHSCISSWFSINLEVISEKLSEGLRMRSLSFMKRWAQVMPPDVFEDRAEGYRTVCNAAEALWYLEKRQNSVVADRLAIMANLCNYDIRLETRRLDSLGYGFSVCAMVLSVLNGDMSLLAGQNGLARAEVRKVDKLVSATGDQGGRHGFSWALGREVCLDGLPFVDKDEVVLRISVKGLRMEDGLSVEGTVWVVDRSLGLRSLEARLLCKFGVAAVEEAQREDKTLWISKETPTRAIKVYLLIGIISLCVERGLKTLATLMWKAFRRKPTARQLKASAEIRQYAEASYESILDLTMCSVKWESPIPPLTRRAVDRHLDPFQGLLDNFALWLLRTTMQTGYLPIGRPVSGERSQASYAACFDTSQLGDMFFTPCSNFGVSAPNRQYSWYPMTWRVTPTATQRSSDDAPSVYTCRGLVCGHWIGKEIDVETVHLV
jgi:hypothetical protein